MPQRLKAIKPNKSLPTMLGALNPSRINYKNKNNPRYRIDQDTLQMMPPLDTTDHTDGSWEDTNQLKVYP